MSKQILPHSAIIKWGDNALGGILSIFKDYRPN